MNKYIVELLTEMLFDFNDLRLGHTYKDVGYESKAEFFKEMSNKIEDLYSRLEKESAPCTQ